MNNAKLVALVLVATVLLVITVGLYARRPSGPTDFGPGTALLPGLDPDKIGEIAIKQGDDTVTVKRQGEGFVLAERSDYPASLKEINSLIIKCLEIRCAAKITESADNHEELGVAAKSEDAATVTFKNTEGEALVQFIKGRSVEKGSGAYVRLADKDTVYSTESALSLSTDPTSYLDMKIVDVEKDDVRNVHVKTKEGSYSVIREEEFNIVLQNVPEGKQSKGTEHEDLFGALSNLSFSDVAEAEDRTPKWDTTFTCNLKSGITYIVDLAEDDGKHYARFKAKGPAVKSVKITRTESEEELKKKEAILLAVETAGTFTPQHAPWVYELSSWAAEKMRKTLGDLTEDIPKDETPDEIAASHILISYKGAQRSTATRSKDEAKKLAEDVLNMVEEDGANFAELARKHSDGPTKAKGGDLGTFGKGAMAPAFEEAAFGLDVDETSEIVETDFGYHIIRRTK